MLDHAVEGVALEERRLRVGIETACGRAAVEGGPHRRRPRSEEPRGNACAVTMGTNSRACPTSSLFGTMMEIVRSVTSTHRGSRLAAGRLRVAEREPARRARRHRLRIGYDRVPLVRSARLDAKFLPQICILQEAIQRAGERVDVVGRHQSTVDTRAYDLRGKADRGRDDGAGQRHGLDHHDRSRFVSRSADEEVQSLMYPRTVVRPTSPTNSMFSSPAARLSSSAV